MVHRLRNKIAVVAGWALALPAVALMLCAIMAAIPAIVVFTVLYEDVADD